MNSRFDEVAKSMGQTVSRRQALRQFGVGLAAMALACFSFGNKAKASFIHNCTDANCSGSPCPKGTHCQHTTRKYFCYCA